MRTENKLFPPVIKWSGSKRRVAWQLASMAPSHNRYFEPFVGGGALIPAVRPATGKISDSMPELMSLWQAIRDEPTALAENYGLHWTRLQRTGHEYYYQVRESFNKSKTPAELLFLSRTCVNGLIRFNSRGEFNNSLHHSRPGIHPDTLTRIIHEWSSLVKNLETSCEDYEQAVSGATEGDFVFLDPPYAGTRGRYRPEKFDFDRLCRVLKSLTDRGVKWMLTLDGTAGGREYRESLPPLPSKYTFAVNTGHSPFTRLMGSSLDLVSESVHLNFDPRS
ncbi:MULTISPECIES: DNA adenine methylase [Dietzia]|uniref:DNA adenine methylase n=1 Tax=Dietzia TaxID=37914 RepID=UPI0018DB6D54